MVSLFPSAVKGKRSLPPPTKPVSTELASCLTGAVGRSCVVQAGVNVLELESCLGMQAAVLTVGLCSKSFAWSRRRQSLKGQVG